MATAPDNLSDLQKHLAKALKIMDERRENYELAVEYADGTRAEVAATKAIKSLIEDAADASPVSLAHIPIEVLADKVQLASLTASESGPARILTDRAEANDLEDECDEWIRLACTFGDYYVIVDPTTDDEAGDVAPDGILWIGSSPLTTVMVYDQEDQRTPLYGAKVWKAGKSWRARLYYDDSTVRLITPKTDGNTSLDPNLFELDPPGDLDDEAAWIEHPGDRMLLHHLAIEGRPYGVPVHRKAWGPQDAITKISATNLVNVDSQGFASRWALADPEAEIDDDMDADFGTDGPGTAADKSDGMSTATSGKTRVRSTPGAISILRGIKSVGTFDASGSEDFIKNLDWYVRVMAVATGIALFEFDLKGDQPSGESRRRAESRAIKRADKIKRAASRFLVGIGDTTLALSGTRGSVIASFLPSETATDKEGLELVSSKIKAGVPVRKAFLEAGYTADEVEGWFPDDAPAVTPELLTIFAEALTKLGQAQTLGVITGPELQAMLPELLTGARGEGPAIEDDEPVDGEIVTDPATQLKAQADAVAVLINAGADPDMAALAAGLDGVDFPNEPVARSRTR